MTISRSKRVPKRDLPRTARLAPLARPEGHSSWRLTWTFHLDPLTEAIETCFQPDLRDDACRSLRRRSDRDLQRPTWVH